ncbi:hypothetical protein FMGBMHLM_0830 [Methylobacterium aerolatum]|nr:hypothetical protein FMGBMHLM_0830 [Methylobacterium aerolatum]
MVTTRRVRHGIVLALAGLLAGLGIVAALFWDGGLPLRGLTGGPDSPPGAAKPSTLADIPAVPPGTGDRDSSAAAPDGASPRPPAPGQAAQGQASQEQAAQEQAAQGSTAQGSTPAAPGDQAARSAATPDKTAPADTLRFDIVRVEPNGDAVVAGRGKPNTVVEMLVDGQPVARALADPTGQFAIVPPPLPKGSSEIVLRSKSADGTETRSTQSVAISISPKGDTQPLVALTSPDAPTVVLSQPGAMAQAPAAPGATEAAKPDGARTAAGRPGTGQPEDSQALTSQAQPPQAQTAQAQVAPLRIVSVDAEPTGRLYISGVGIAGTQVRLYLNDTLITPAKVGADGHVTFTIGRGISPGRYKVRVEEVDPGTGKVAHRAEVAFVMPEPVAGPGDTRQAANTPADPARTAKAPPQAGATAPQAGKSAPPPSNGTAAEPPNGTGPGGDTAVARSGGATGATPGEMAATAPRRDDDGQADRPGAVYVPAITTAKITRGDSLWQISKRTYGRGRRYTVIYDANQDQIRDPDLIYPGQTFVLPMEGRG